MGRLSYEQRMAVVRRKDAGFSYTAIAKTFGVSRQAVISLISKYRETGSVKDVPGCGRKRATSVREDRNLVRASLQNRKLTAVELRQQLAAAGTDVTVQTVRSRLREAGLNSRVAAKKPLVTAANKRARLQFAKDHCNWSADDWKRVLWSDEASFELFDSRRHVLVRRRIGERYDAQCVVPTVKFGGGKLMVWGCFSGGGLGELRRVTGTLNAAGYKELLQDSMLPSAKRLFRRGRFVFQQDNAPCHKARSVMDYLGRKQVDLLMWPPQSPDFNPIENLWGIVKRKVALSKPTTLEDLWTKVLEAWQSIGQEEIDRLLASMPRRMKLALRAKGGITKY